MQCFKCLLFASLLATGPALALGTALDKGEKEAVVRKVGELLTMSYVFPDRAALAKARIAAELAAGDYDAITDPVSFAQRLTADLQSVTRDKHMEVFVPTVLSPPPDSPARPTSNAGFARVDLLKANIGYIKLMGFPSPGPFNWAADQAITDLASTEALIIDMRDNRGGNPDSVAYLCSFFFDPKIPVHLNDLYYRKPSTNEFTKTEFWTRPATPSYLGKPVYVLTSNRTFSGGEEFVNDLKVQKRAKLIGETTGGGANPGGTMPIDDHFGMFIPSGRAENPVTRTSWEGTGVTPDVPVAESRAFQVAMLELLANRSDAAATAVKAQLITDIDASKFVEAHLLKFRSAALPGGAESIKRLLEELARGVPNYNLMSNNLADATREQLPALQTEISKLGVIKSVTFDHVEPAGLDVYNVTLANGALQCGIFVTPDGKTQSAWLH